MNQVFLIAGIVLFVLILLTLYRGIFGPLIFDRILGGNLVGTKSMILLLIIGILHDNLSMFVDIAIAYAMLNFITTLGVTRLFFRKRSVLDTTDEGPALETIDE